MWWEESWQWSHSVFWAGLDLILLCRKRLAPTLRKCVLDVEMPSLPRLVQVPPKLLASVGSTSLSRMAVAVAVRKEELQSLPSKGRKLYVSQV